MGGRVDGRREEEKREQGKDSKESGRGGGGKERERGKVGHGKASVTTRLSIKSLANESDDGRGELRGG